MKVRIKDLRRIIRETIFLEFEKVDGKELGSNSALKDALTHKLFEKYNTAIHEKEKSGGCTTEMLIKALESDDEFKKCKNKKLMLVHLANGWTPGGVLQPAAKKIDFDKVIEKFS